MGDLLDLLDLGPSKPVAKPKKEQKKEPKPAPKPVEKVVVKKKEKPEKPEVVLESLHEWESEEPELFLVLLHYKQSRTHCQANRIIFLTLLKKLEKNYKGLTDEILKKKSRPYRKKVH